MLPHQKHNSMTCLILFALCILYKIYLHNYVHMIYTVYKVYLTYQRIVITLFLLIEANKQAAI